MQIIGYPGDRVDFVSRSGSAGSIMFGDPRSLVEEFFGPAHTEATADGRTELSYYSGALSITLADARVVAVSAFPQRSREKMQVQVGKQRIADVDLGAFAGQVEVERALADDIAAGELVRVTFR